MEYLLELQWPDPVGRAVAAILSTLPDDVEQTTSSVPIGLSRGFTVLRCETSAVLDDLAHAVAAAGADVRVIPKGGDDSRN